MWVAEKILEWKPENGVLVQALSMTCAGLGMSPVLSGLSFWIIK